MRDRRRYSRDVDEGDHGYRSYGSGEEFEVNPRNHRDSLQIYEERREKSKRSGEGSNPPRDAGTGSINASRSGGSDIPHGGGRSSKSSQMDVVKKNDQPQQNVIVQNPPPVQQAQQEEEVAPLNIDLNAEVKTEGHEGKNHIVTHTSFTTAKMIDISSVTTKYRTDIIQLSKGYCVFVGNTDVKGKKPGSHDWKMESLIFRRNNPTDKKHFDFSIPADLIPELRRACAIILKEETVPGDENHE